VTTGPPHLRPRDDRLRRVTWGSRSEYRRLLGRLQRRGKRRGKRYPDGVAEHLGRADQGPDVGILVTIRALLPNLAPVERRVAQIVLDDPAGVAWRSISELARSCGTSATSVVRFCRAVGLRGYPELRLALAGAVAHDDAAAVAAASSDIDPDDDAATITKKIAFADARAVTETASHLNIVTLTQVVDALAKASRIAQLTVVDCLFVTLAQQDLPRTRVALERTFAAAQAKRVRRPRRRPPGA
jgi:DNA-binding MurR/RpiR family transcriptional regulator